MIHMHAGAGRVWPVQRERAPADATNKIIEDCAEDRAGMRPVGRTAKLQVAPNFATC